MKFEEIYKDEAFLTRENDNLIISRVSEVQRELYKVICQYGETNTKLKGAFYKDRMNREYPVWGKNKSIYTKKGKLENKIKRGKK